MSMLSVSSAGRGTIWGRVEMKSWNRQLQQHRHGEAGEQHGGAAGPPHRPEGEALQEDGARHGDQHGGGGGHREGQAGGAAKTRA